MKLNDYIEKSKGDLINSVQRVVKIKSTLGESKPNMPYGEGPGKVLEEALKIASELGFKTKNVDGYVGYAEYGEGKELVGVLGHLDVVPEGSGWKYPPYGAEIHDGKIYGRGTTDDKGPIIAALYGLKAIKDSNLKLTKRVRILFGTNEETGSNEIKYYLDHDEAPDTGFTPDANYPIIYAEKGITMFNVVKKFNKKSNNIKIEYIRGGERANMVPDRCECKLQAIDETKLSDIINKIDEFIEKSGYDINYKKDGQSLMIYSIGVGAHGSLPAQGKNAIMHLLILLNSIYKENDDIRDFIEFFVKNIGMETNGKILGIYLKDDMGDLTLNVGTIKMDENSVSIGFNIRYPVTKKYDDWMNIFEKKLNENNLRIEDMNHQLPLYFPPDHPLIKTLTKVYEEQTGKEAKLLAIGGGTYAKEMKNIVAYGPIFPGKPDLDHQSNEYIEIDDLILNAKIYANAIYELAK